MAVRTSKQRIVMFCEECGITEDKPSLYQRYCRFCGSKIVPDDFWDEVIKERMNDWKRREDCISKNKVKQMVCNLTAEYDTETIPVDRLINELDNLR